jgi:hypothetical protein
MASQMTQAEERDVQFRAAIARARKDVVDRMATFRFALVRNLSGDVRIFPIAG